MKKINNVKDFNEIIKTDNLTVVKFSAEWCGPCRQLASTIDSIENDYEKFIVLSQGFSGEGEKLRKLQPVVQN